MRRSLISTFHRVVALSVALVTTGAVATAQLRHDHGQTVGPAFEGWEPNPDGTFSLYFGYMNRNYKQVLDIPIGPNNRMEPGGPDRGQPTHFLTRRHKNVFRVVVPKDFGTQKLVWSLTVNGNTESVPGSLDPRYQIETRRNPSNGNTPPVIKSPSELKATETVPASITVHVTDDNLPVRAGKPIGVTVEWSKYRGPDDVAFSPVTHPLTGGSATTNATFSSPGEYVIQAVANDGSRGGTSCCWTTALVKVVVN